MFHLILNTKSEKIISPPIQPLHPRMKVDDGRILMLIVKTGKEIVETCDDVISWSASWRNDEY